MDIYGFLTIQQSIVFVERRADADAIARTLQSAGMEISAMHGGLSPPERDALMEEFRSGKTKVLITTNVLARGIDIPSVAVVVNYDLPYDRDPRTGADTPDPATYLHRIGRCGRFGRRGTAITFLETPKDHFDLEMIERYYNSSQRLTTEWDPNEIEELSAEIKSRPQANLDDTAKDGNDPNNTGLSITLL
jgi:ATP-dependent RNA helicase DDX19/DBP5